jgi:hypothetical protein
MATAEFKRALASTRELEITVTGRTSGRRISLPVWFVDEGNRLSLLPVKGSDSDWYKNILRTPAMTLSAGGTQAAVNARPITEPNAVHGIVDRFTAKYGAADVQRYYSKFDVAVEVSLD